MTNARGSTTDDGPRRARDRPRTEEPIRPHEPSPVRSPDEPTPKRPPVPASVDDAEAEPKE